jgi:hypothetical protein
MVTEIAMILNARSIPTGTCTVTTPGIIFIIQQVIPEPKK